jgi:hypothetical protein
MVVAYRIAHAIVTEYGVAGGQVACAVGYGVSLTWTVTVYEQMLRERASESFGLGTALEPLCVY